jgi:ribonuclease HI
MENKRVEKMSSPEIARLFLETMKRKEKEGTIIQFIKVKGHTGIKGNEEVDIRVKEGIEKERTYINKIDLLEYRNEMDLVIKEKEIRSNFRREIKK